MEKNMKYALVGISVALAIITAVYTMGIMKRRAQMLLGRGHEVYDIGLPFREVRTLGAQDMYEGMSIRRESWISFQSKLLEHSKLGYGKPYVMFNWCQMWFMSYEANYGYSNVEWIVYITSLI